MKAFSKRDLQRQHRSDKFCGAFIDECLCFYLPQLLSFSYQVQQCRPEFQPLIIVSQSLATQAEFQWCGLEKRFRNRVTGLTLHKKSHFFLQFSQQTLTDILGYVSYNLIASKEMHLMTPTAPLFTQKRKITSIKCVIFDDQSPQAFFMKQIYKIV